MTNIDDITAQRIRAVRAAEKLGVNDVARILGITRDAASLRLNGKTPFSLKEVALFAEATGYDSADFISDTFTLHEASRKNNEN